MRIDSHQHFWQYKPEEFAWINNEMQAFKRDHYPGDLEPLLKATGVDGTICVQARLCMAETHWLLELAKEYPFIRGGVGWVPLCGPGLLEELELLATKPKFRGVRHPLQIESDDRFTMRRDFLHGIRLLAQFALTYDLLIFPAHLSTACALARLCPEQRFVIDHLGSPHFLRDGGFEEWARGMRQIAGCKNVFCKLSGFITEVAPQNWTTFDFRPYLDGFSLWLGRRSKVYQGPEGTFTSGRGGAHRRRIS